jgi:Rod binding domain-containing protein
MSLLAPIARGTSDAKQAAEQLEALLVKQVVSSAHLFSASQSAGSSLRADLFSEALAEAVAKQGGLGISGGLLPKETSRSALNESVGRVEAGIEGPSDPRHV